jgi:hypothetical protein
MPLTWHSGTKVVTSAWGVEHKTLNFVVTRNFQKLNPVRLITTYAVHICGLRLAFCVYEQFLVTMSFKAHKDLAFLHIFTMTFLLSYWHSFIFEAARKWARHTVHIIFHFHSLQSREAVVQPIKYFTVRAVYCRGKQ